MLDPVWLATLAAILVMGTMWVFRGGGEILARHGFLSVRSARDAKLLAVVSLMALAMMILVDFWGAFR